MNLACGKPEGELLVGSPFNCWLTADHFLPASFILTSCWFPQELKQPRSEKSPETCRCPLGPCSLPGKGFGCNRIFCKMVLSLNASMGQLWLSDPVEGMPCPLLRLVQDGERKQEGVLEPWKHKKESTAGCEEPPTAWQGRDHLCQPYFLQRCPYFLPHQGEKGVEVGGPKQTVAVLK